MTVPVNRFLLQFPAVSFDSDQSGGSSCYENNKLSMVHFVTSNTNSIALSSVVTIPCCIQAAIGNIFIKNA